MASDTDAPAISGWLHKAGSKEDDSDRKWFVLRGATLSYYNSPDDATGAPRRTIEIKGAKIETAGVGSTGRYKIRIRAPSTPRLSSTEATPATTRVYVIEAESEVECNQWVEMLTRGAGPPPFEAAATAATPPQPAAARERLSGQRPSASAGDAQPPAPPQSAGERLSGQRPSSMKLLYSVDWTTAVEFCGFNFRVSE